MKTLKLGLLLMLFGAPNSVHAQFTPVSAKIRQTDTKKVDGKDVVIVKEGNYYRSSDGSVLIQWLTVNGEKAWDGTLEDNAEPAFYHLDYKQQRAYQEASHPGHTAKPGSFSVVNDIGGDSVEGVPCRIAPVKLVPPGQSSQQARQEAGRVCVSAQYDLMLWEDWNVVPTERSRLELYGIKIGVEPDRGLFDVKSRFTVFAAKSSSPDLKKPQ